MITPRNQDATNRSTSEVYLRKPYGIEPRSDAGTESCRDLESLSKVYSPLASDFLNIHEKYNSKKQAFISAWAVRPIPNWSVVFKLQDELQKLKDQLHNAYNNLNEETKYGPAVEDESLEGKEVQKMRQKIQDFHTLGLLCGKENNQWLDSTYEDYFKQYNAFREELQRSDEYEAAKANQKGSKGDVTDQHKIE
ncbi:hypothetical protein K491DRAFT_722685 [Lophiostoma macrostomum CBS 122681]|uniref:Uncharacterized protein n=1 Tax=Lophiostoma macrostomum CBS 122681 TaxID=1314788 RepID=A0A6A6SMY7_9PLEO|nr:hypothetical protein K491DRAFT_722685 [Lophiostoma macrostomum CBS 122681]